jgi:hypothetical protein
MSWVFTQKGKVYKPRIRPSGSGWICGGFKIEAFGYSIEDSYKYWQSAVARRIFLQYGEVT